MNAQIFVQFEDRVKKTIDLSTEGYVRPIIAYYGFTSSKYPNNDTIWYNLKGEPGSEISKDFYTRIIKNEPPVFVFEGFKVKINPYLGFKKIIYRVNYCYKYRGTHEHDSNDCRDGNEVFIYEAPPMDFWDAVTY